MLHPFFVLHDDGQETHLAGLPVTSHTAGVGAGGAFWGCSHAGVSMFFTSRKVCRASKQSKPSDADLSNHTVKAEVNNPTRAGQPPKVPVLVRKREEVRSVSLPKADTSTMRPTRSASTRCAAGRSQQTMYCAQHCRWRHVSKEMDSEGEAMSARQTQSALLHSVVPEACARHEKHWQALKAPCWLLYASSCRTAHRRELRDGWEADMLQNNAGPLTDIAR